MDCRTQLAYMAIDEVEKGDFLMATEILTTGIKMSPNNHELYFERSICHHKLGDYQASLDDANAAIRINSSDYNIHYQRGLALIGLNLFPEAVTSFKKAIELRAKQDDSKLSDIFKLLRDATNELNTARRRPGLTANQTRGESSSSSATLTATTNSLPSTTQVAQKSLAIGGVTTNNEPVDSTTDKSPSMQTDEQIGIEKVNIVVQNGSSSADSNTNNLVSMTNRNIKTSCANQLSDDSLVAASRVTSSANQFNSIVTQQNSPSVILAPTKHHAPRDTKIVESQDLSNIVGQHCQPSKSSTSSSYDWSIRRSERIFLHNTNEPGTSGSGHQDQNGQEMSVNKLKNGSTPSSISSSKGVQKRSLDRNSYQPSKATRSKNGTSSHVDSDVDVDDSQQFDTQQSNHETNANNKRVMIAPSSSMPATSQTSISAKEDSYSSKYKRLRRDRERARRGTSKLCTIKIGDLEDLRKSSGHMRVIAPIDGWLYSGQLSLDASLGDDGLPQYVVKLDGDTSGSSYLFTQSTVLNDVIKEVKVKTVSELRKGARICCYWSRTYKCLSTGVVTSRTFEVTKSLVSVKYDNGDLSALPLEDLRLLPPDYPKYMSNCDPLLLAKNNDNRAAASLISNGNSRIVVNVKSSSSTSNATYSKAIVDAIIKKCDDTDLTNSAEQEGRSPNIAGTNNQNSVGDAVVEQRQTRTNGLNEDIPPTNQTIEFLTREDDNFDTPNDPDDTNQERGAHSSLDPDAGRINGTQVITSCISSEENNFGIEYRPWRFEGSPKRTKRNGRIYRDTYFSIRRGNEVIKVGDSAELMPRDESILPFIAKIDGLWANTRGEMRVRVRWYYRLVETEGAPYELEDGENALFETDHFDENDVQSIWRTTKILSWTDYSRDHLRHVNKPSDGPKIFYLAGYYDPVRRVKHLRSDVKDSAI